MTFTTAQVEALLWEVFAPERDAYLKSHVPCACGHLDAEHYPSESQLAVKPYWSKAVDECHGEECNCSAYEPNEADR